MEGAGAVPPLLAGRDGGLADEGALLGKAAVAGSREAEGGSGGEVRGAEPDDELGDASELCRLKAALLGGHVTPLFYATTPAAYGLLALPCSHFLNMPGRSFIFFGLTVGLRIGG